MGKSIKSEMVPLIKQPVDVILATARAAGRAALVTRAIVEEHRTDISLGWFNSVMPSSLGVMDDDAFSDLMAKMGDAFDEGFEEYLSHAEGTVVGLSAECKVACDNATDALFLASNAFFNVEQLLIIVRDELDSGIDMDKTRVAALVQIGIDLTRMRGELVGEQADTFSFEVGHV